MRRRWPIGSIQRIALGVALTFCLGACASARTVAWNHYERGLEECFNSRWEDCAEAYDRSLETGYHVPGIHADYGVLLARDGQMAGAEAQFVEEVTQHPESAALVHKLGTFLQESGPTPAPPATSAAPNEGAGAPAPASAGDQP